MKIVVAVLLVGLCWPALSERDLRGYTFETYKTEFHKSYSTQAEHQRRQSIFEARLDQILKHNNNPEDSSYKLGVNAFSDMLESERRLRGINKALLHHQRHSIPTTPNAPVNLTNLPAAVDWRTHQPSIVTAVVTPRSRVLASSLS